MIQENDLKLIKEILARSTAAQKLWLAGYVQAHCDIGNITATGAIGATVSAPAAAAQNLEIYFATETGNTKKFAQTLEKAAKAAGIKAKTNPFNKVDLKQLSGKETLAVFMTSTHGEGEAPDAAKKLFKSLDEAKDIDLSKLRFATIGLGDTAYQHFCQSAVDVEAKLIKLGAKTFHAITKLNIDFEDYVDSTCESVLKALPSAEGASSVPTLTASPKPKSSKGYNRLHPVKGIVKDIVNLNDHGSPKETYHIEITFEDDIAYTPGDALGIMIPVEINGENPTPRLYSISSSQAEVGNEVHITVALAWYLQPDGAKGFGLASGYLAKLQEGDEVQFYINRNEKFRLPENDATDVIMVGPGTGIAPFRSFVQDRSAKESAGRNWLFFGELNAHNDFLYQIEWQDYLASGVLTHLDLAFSRDQKERVYVQHRMMQKGKELMDWIEGGAILYVCGRKDPMSYDVDKSLMQIFQTHLGLDAAAAEQKLLDLADDGRYLKDVY